jgi:hypothetical protein
VTVRRALSRAVVLTFFPLLRVDLAEVLEEAARLGKEVGGLGAFGAGVGQDAGPPALGPLFPRGLLISSASAARVIVGGDFFDPTCL